MSDSSLWRNIMINTDGNKSTNFAMYPDDMEYMSAYLEARGGPFPAGLFVGLQAFLLEYLTRQITVDDINAAERLLGHEMGVRFNRQAWLDIVNEHDGYLPIEIEAVPEGTVVPTGNVLMQVVNTDPKFAWLPTFIETALMRAVWYPSTVGTISWFSKQALRGALERTSDHPELLRAYLEDFGFRGVSSFESAALGGLAHMVNFDASNTIAGTIAATEFYNARTASCASWLQEHSVTTSWGRDREIDSFRKVLSYSGSGVAGLLADTYDHDYAVRTIIGKELHDEILAFPGMVSVRCDSGDPVTTPADTVEALMESFGYTVNSKGFKVLNDKLRVVQSDGLEVDTYADLYAELERRGLAADNVICGMGAGLLQHANRDTMYIAYKTNAVKIGGTWHDVSKSPKGSAVKRSKAGRLALQYIDGDYRTVPRDSIPAEENVLVPVFRNGKILRLWDFDELIERSERPTPAYYYAGVETEAASEPEAEEIAAA